MTRELHREASRHEPVCRRLLERMQEQTIVRRRWGHGSSFEASSVSWQETEAPLFKAVPDRATVMSEEGDGPEAHERGGPGGPGRHCDMERGGSDGRCAAAAHKRGGALATASSWARPRPRNTPGFVWEHAVDRPRRRQAWGSDWAQRHRAARWVAPMFRCEAGFSARLLANLVGAKAGHHGRRVASSALTRTLVEGASLHAPPRTQTTTPWPDGLSSSRTPLTTTAPRRPIAALKPLAPLAK